MGCSSSVVKKEDSSLRLCIDYQELNVMVVTDVYPLQKIDDLFDPLSEVAMFLRIDLRLRYHQLKVSLQVF